MRMFLLYTLLLAAVCLAGCDDDNNGNAISSYITLHDKSVAVHAPGRPDADISPTGELNIANKSIALTDSERALLRHYHVTAFAVRDHGIATGKAGAATGMTAIRSVASNLANGTPDKIDSEVNASAVKVEAKVALICNDLADLRSTQETLANQLPAFRPYATIKADEAQRCRGEVHERR